MWVSFDMSVVLQIWQRVENLGPRIGTQRRRNLWQPDDRLKFSKVISPLNLLYRMSLRLTFENCHQCRERLFICHCQDWNLSKVSTFLNFLCKMSMELTFENWYKCLHSCLCQYWMLPKVSTSLSLLYKISIELTFENCYQCRERLRSCLCQYWIFP